ncbi:unnamed protein product [Ixodes pacificus]
MYTIIYRTTLTDAEILSFLIILLYHVSMVTGSFIYFFHQGNSFNQLNF